MHIGDFMLQLSLLVFDAHMRFYVAAVRPHTLNAGMVFCIENNMD